MAGPRGTPLGRTCGSDAEPRGPEQRQPVHHVRQCDRAAQRDDGFVYRYTVASGTWANLTPKTDDGTAYLGNGGQNNGFGFGGVSVDAADPNYIVISTLNSYGGQTRFSGGSEGYGDRIYVTKDGGATWTTGFSYKDPKVAANANASANGNAWVAGTAIHWAGDIALNPVNRQEAWIISGNGIFHTTNLGDAIPVWSFDAQGIEETVPLDIVERARGAAGHRHRRLRRRHLYGHLEELPEA